MTATELIAYCTSLDILLCPAGDDGLYFDAPEGALDANLQVQLKASKEAVRAALLDEWIEVRRSDGGRSWVRRSTEHCDQEDQEIVPAVTPICGCGSTTWRDVVVHDRQSVRRDCAGCRRFIGFTVWYGREVVATASRVPEKTSQTGQPP